MIVDGSGPKSQVVSPCFSTLGAAAATVSRTFGASRCCRAARSLPSASVSPSSPSTRNVIRRWSGTFVQSQAPDGTAVPVEPVQLGPSASSSPPAGVSCASASAAKSGTGTKLRRVALGSDRISATTRSWRSPGTCQLERLRPQPGQQRQRYVHGHAVGVGTGLELVRQPQRQVVVVPEVRVVGRTDPVRALVDQHRLGERQQVRFGVPGLLPPRVEVAARTPRRPAAAGRRTRTASRRRPGCPAAGPGAPTPPPRRAVPGCRGRTGGGSASRPRPGRAG